MAMNFRLSMSKAAWKIELNYAIKQWKIEKPTYQDARLFLSTLYKANFSNSPLNIFFEKLSIPEMFATMMLFDVIDLAAR